MTKQVQRRRGTSAQHTGFTGAEGEISVNTTNKSIHVHDGVTAGGIEAARADLDNVTTANVTSAISGGTVASLTITSADINGGTIDGVTIGGASAGAGTFTTLTTGSTVTLNGGTANGVLYLNGSKVATSGSALTFDGASLKNSGVIVSGASGSAGVFTLNRSSDGNGIAVFESLAGTNNVGLRNAQGDILFSAAGSEQMRLTSTGLGIGTSSPSGKLDVTGSVGTVRVETTGNKISFTRNGANYIGAANGASASISYEAPVHYFNSGDGITTRLIINDSGNVGIGTTSPGERLNVVGGGGTTSTVNFTGGSGNDNATIASDYSLVFQVDANNNIGGREFTWKYGGKGYSDGTMLMNLNASGNLGLGVPPSAATTSTIQLPSNTTISGAGSAASFAQNAIYNTGWKYITTAGASLYQGYQGNHYWYTAPSGTAGNTITFTQAMTLDASGNLLVGTTGLPNGTSVYGTALSPQSNGRTIIYQATNQTAAQTIQAYYNPNGQVGTIATNGSATAYNTSSDYRLKNITGPITNSGEYIDSLNPVEGTWKVDGSTFVGLIAHEVQEVSRTQVATGEKDGEEMQGMDYSSAEIIANLIAEVKALRQRVATLEAK